LSLVVKTIRLCLALIVMSAAPALAHDGVHILSPYARSNGGLGANGAVFFTIKNHSGSAERLIGVSSDVAEKVEMHTHSETADGVMQMLAVPKGFAIDARMSHALDRGGDHIMLMGLTRALKDGDSFILTLTFEHAGVVIIKVPVDNARKSGAAGRVHSGKDHSRQDMTGVKPTE